MKHIFIVDDEQHIRDLISKYLVKEGYQTTTFKDGLKLVDNVRSLDPDLIVLDINMPGVDGLELCKEIRKFSEVPIIFVTARDDEFDRVIGLELGGDDYLSKPFSPRELLARIKNVFKRLDKADKKLNSDCLEIKDVVVAKHRRQVTAGGQELSLTTKEYELFTFLCENANMPFNREGLIERIWGYDYVGDLRVIDDLVKRLRKKLKEANSELEITTVWGYGYKIEK